MATEGFGKSAELEARENQTFQQIEAAKDAQKMQTLGAGAGIGAMYGLKAGAATTAGAAAGGGAGAAFAPFGVASAGATTGGAAAGGSALAGAAALATPIAIGLGVAFLINELFD
tara:strand:- start:34 stop:378 length:345 start_codon:yes stop_codon:yes gene_type:complete